MCDSVLVVGTVGCSWQRTPTATRTRPRYSSGTPPPTFREGAALALHVDRDPAGGEPTRSSSAGRSGSGGPRWGRTSTASRSATRPSSPVSRMRERPHRDGPPAPGAGARIHGLRGPVGDHRPPRAPRAGRGCGYEQRSSPITRALRSPTRARRGSSRPPGSRWAVGARGGGRPQHLERPDDPGVRAALWRAPEDGRHRMPSREALTARESAGASPPPDALMRGLPSHGAGLCPLLARQRGDGGALHARRRHARGVADTASWVSDLQAGAPPTGPPEPPPRARRSSSRSGWSSQRTSDCGRRAASIDAPSGGATNASTAAPARPRNRPGRSRLSETKWNVAGWASRPPERRRSQRPTNSSSDGLNAPAQQFAGTCVRPGFDTTGAYGTAGRNCRVFCDSHVAILISWRIVRAPCLGYGRLTPANAGGRRLRRRGSFVHRAFGSDQMATDFDRAGRAAYQEAAGRPLHEPVDRS